jgi:hypothetical protein
MPPNPTEIIAGILLAWLGGARIIAFFLGCLGEWCLGQFYNPSGYTERCWYIWCLNEDTYPVSLMVVLFCGPARIFGLKLLI